MKRSFQTFIYCAILITGSLAFQTSCEFNTSEEVFDELNNGIEHPTVDEEDERKQEPK